MPTPTDIADSYQFTKTRQVLTCAQTDIAGLSTFGHDVSAKAQMPLIPHVHSGKIEFVALLRGTQSYILNGEAYTLYGGDVFFTRPDEVHSTGRAPCCINDMLWFQIDLRQEEGLLGLTAQKAREVRALLLTERPRLLHHHAAVKNLMRAFSLLVEENPDARLRGHMLFLYALMSVLSPSRTDLQRTEDILRAQQIIAHRLREEVRIDELASAVGLSTSRFKEKFIEQVGMNPREYINHRKIESAKADLIRTAKSLTDIAMDYQFSSSSYFSTVFRKFTGLSPTEYRKQQEDTAF